MYSLPLYIFGQFIPLDKNKFLGLKKIKGYETIFSFIFSIELATFFL
jgi:hypothetical protein